MTISEKKCLKEWLQRHFRRRKTPKLYRGQEKFHAAYEKYQIGIGTYGIPHVHDWDEGTTLEIGAYTSIADDVHIFLGGHHRCDWISQYPFPVFVEEAAHIRDYGGTRGNVIIGNDVWLASGCSILSGVSIGDGAVVAARAVVTRDVEPYAVVAGNPASLIRYRFEREIREALQKIAWWHWPEAEIRQICKLLCSNDLRGFLAYAEARQRQEIRGANG